MYWLEAAQMTDDEIQAAFLSGDVGRLRAEVYRISGPTAEWQPIETAPKDRPILLYGSSPHQYAAAIWEPYHAAWACCWDNWPIEDFAARYWMPLPAPPQVKRREALDALAEHDQGLGLYDGPKSLKNKD